MEAILSNSTRELLRFEISKMLIALKKIHLLCHLHFCSLLTFTAWCNHTDDSVTSWGFDESNGQMLDVALVAPHLQWMFLECEHLLLITLPLGSCVFAYSCKQGSLLYE